MNLKNMSNMMNNYMILRDLFNDENKAYIRSVEAYVKGCSFRDPLFRQFENRLLLATDSHEKSKIKKCLYEMEKLFVEEYRWEHRLEIRSRDTLKHRLYMAQAHIINMLSHIIPEHLHVAEKRHCSLYTRLFEKIALSSETNRTLQMRQICEILRLSSGLTLPQVISADLLLFSHLKQCFNNLLSSRYHLPAHLNFIFSSDIRPSFQPPASVYYNDCVTVPTLVHELMHLVEAHNPVMKFCSLAFLKSRARGASLKPMNDIVGRKSYDDSELGRDIKKQPFFHPYCTKVCHIEDIYDNDAVLSPRHLTDYAYAEACEVMPMGLEELLTYPRHILADKAYFYFILSNLRHEF